MALAAGCRGTPKVVVSDLVERSAVARRTTLVPLVLFGTPAAEPHEAEGFFRWSGGRGDRFVWARKDVEVALWFDRPEARAAVVDLLPFRGVQDQRVSVSLNGTPVAAFAMNAYRHRYQVPLPAAAQRAGANRLRFVFGATASLAEVDPKSRDGSQLAAAFYSLSVAAPGDAWLEEQLGRDAPRPFAQLEEGGVPALVVPGGAAVQYAFQVPDGGELRFAPELHNASRTRGAGARVRVTLHDGAREQVLWSRELTARDATPGEVVVPLRGSQGRPVRLGLHVEGAPEPRRAWVVWRAARLLGSDGGGSRSSAAAERVARLRSALAGSNVLLVVLDAARAQQLGCYGYARATTPQVDRLATEGVLFESAFTPAVYTVGAMSSLWTSQQPDQHHGDTSFGARLPDDRLTLSELLAARGIHTGGFVANAMAGRASGFDRGFAEFHELFGDPELGSRAEVFAQVLPQFLRRNRDRRFFAYVHFREPHFPYDPPPPFDTRFGPKQPLPRSALTENAWYVSVNRGAVSPSSAEIDHLLRAYDGNLAYVDQEVGRLRRVLETEGLLEKTTLVVLADHGEQLYEHGYISHSTQLYEQSVRVPLIVRFPRTAGLSGLRVDSLVDLLDVAPTIADLLGALGQGGSARAFEGRSLLPLIAAGGSTKRAVLSRSVWERPRYMLRDERYKLIRDTRSGEEELYDLGADPGESRNLVASEPLRADALREELLVWTSRLRQRRAAAAEAVSLTREQCENMKSLGYLDACR